MTPTLLKKFTFAAPESPLAHLDEKLGPTISVEAVARFLVPLLPVTCLDHSGIADATDRVMPATAVFNDRNEDAPHVGVADVTTGQERRVLRLERVSHVIALEFFMRVEKQRRTVAAPAAIGQAEREAALKDERPVPRTRQKLVINDAIGIEWLGRHGLTPHDVHAVRRGR